MLEESTFHRRFTAQRSRRTDNAGTVDGQRYAAHEFICGGNGSLNRFLRGHVGLDEPGTLAERGSALFAFLGIEVQQNCMPARIDDSLGSRIAQSVKRDPLSSRASASFETNCS